MKKHVTTEKQVLFLILTSIIRAIEIGAKDKKVVEAMRAAGIILSQFQPIHDDTIEVEEANLKALDLFDIWASKQ